MLLSDEQLKKFQELYKTHFGKDISKEEAYDKGHKLVRLMALILQVKDVRDNENSALQEKDPIV